MIVLNNIGKQFSSKDRKYIGRYFLRNVLNDFIGILSGNRNDKRLKVLRDISFTVNKGEHVGLVGRNKAGKSTLLQLISGISAPDSGTMRVEGSIIPVFGQGSVSTPEMTGREYIHFYALALGYSKKVIAELEQKIIDFSEITQIDTPVKFYSTGTRTRLSLATTLLLPADIYILDEVFYGSDVFFKDKISTRILEIQSNPSVTTIMVSHHEDILRKFCNRLLLIDEGTIAKDGGVNDVLETYYNKYHVSSEANA